MLHIILVSMTTFAAFLCFFLTLMRSKFFHMQQQKQNVEDLQAAVSNAKVKYREAMSNLETISEEIHESRKLPLPPREPGVGCESDEEFPTEINLGEHQLL